MALRSLWGQLPAHGWVLDDAGDEIKIVCGFIFLGVWILGWIWIEI